MSFPDTIFIILGALVLFGPRKLPEIMRQAGKILGELRRASNDFKFQMEEEMRLSEDADRRKKQAENPAAVMTPLPPQPPRPPEGDLPIAKSPVARPSSYRSVSQAEEPSTSPAVEPQTPGLDAAATALPVVTHSGTPPEPVQHG